MQYTIIATIFFGSLSFAAPLAHDQHYHIHLDEVSTGGANTNTAKRHVEAFEHANMAPGFVLSQANAEHNARGEMAKDQKDVMHNRALHETSKIGAVPVGATPANVQRAEAGSLTNERADHFIHVGVEGLSDAAVVENKENVAQKQGYQRRVEVGNAQ